MTVFYRKYRPQKISELDSNIIKKQITEVLSSERIPHAFLLTGPRGLGKTSTARIIAKSVNCLHPSKNGEPCGKCDMCISITSGTNLDIMEMDAASNRGIDEIRDLREKIRLAPTAAKYKVYIIDEVHMLTNEAFNALLKTLEEPPEHALFILCTTEVNKLPETIISRCMWFKFAYPTEEEIIESLKRVKEGEKLEIEEEAYKKIANLAKGSFRDAQKILDQASLSGKKITQELVEELFGGKKNKTGDIFLDSLIKKDTKTTLEWLNENIKQGLDLRIWTEECLEYFHEALLFKTAGIKPDERNQEAVKVLSVLTVSDLQQLISLFSRAYGEIKNAVIPELPLEMAIIEWGEEKSQISNLKSQNQNSNLKSEKSNTEDTEKTEGIEGKTQKIEKVTVETQSVVSLPIDDNLLQVWPKILEAVKPINHSVQALLRSARPLGYDGKCLTIEVFYKFHKERLEEPKILELLSDTIGKLFGKSTRVTCVLGRKNKEDIVKAAEEIFGEH